MSFTRNHWRQKKSRRAKISEISDRAEKPSPRPYRVLLNNVNEPDIIALVEVAAQELHEWQNEFLLESLRGALIR
jgi:hypothetical protein